MMLRWPGKPPAVFRHRSSHHDLPSTLLQEVFGCRNPASDYSSGRNLFLQQSWDWVIAGSYTAHAIVEPDQLVVSYPGGFIEVLGSDYRSDPDLQLNAGIMQEAMLEMRRFYR
jgi:membrane-anchored protein YejM (alkaline phosphatase superfamily)